MHVRKRYWRLFETAADQGAAEEGVDGGDGGNPWGDQADTEWARRFPGGPSKMWEAQEEARQTVSRATQEAADARAEVEQVRAEREQAEQQWQDPFAQGGELPQAGVDPALQARLVSLFDKNPAEALDLAERSVPGYGNVYRNMVMQAWQQTDPGAYWDHMVNSRMSSVLDERFQAFEDHLDERLGPALAHSVKQIGAASVHLSRALAPDIGPYEARIEELILAQPSILDGVIGDVEAGAERLVQIRDLLWAKDEREKLMKAGASAEQAEAVVEKKAPTRQRQMTRSDANDPTLVDDDYAKSMSLKGVKLPRGA